MSSNRDVPPAGFRSDDDDRRNEPRVLLFMEPGRNRTLLRRTLDERYRVEATTDVDALETDHECCVLDRRQLRRVADAVRVDRTTVNDVFQPFLLLLDDDSTAATSPDVWEYVDDVLRLPTRKAELTMRVTNLVERHRASVDIAERTAQLEATLEDRALKEQALDEAPIGFIITGPTSEDNPIRYVNDQFEELTGYDEAEILGRNCRFLQGADTDPEARAQLRSATESNRLVTTDVLNYRKNGEKFWNRVAIAPIYDDDGTVTNYAGFQMDVTDRKIRERRLEVLSRVLGHNMRNKMNLIEGHVALLRDEDTDPPAESVAEIEAAASDLVGLADTVREVERIISTIGSAGPVVVLDERVEELVATFADRYPDATFDLVVPDDGHHETAVAGVMTAIEEAIENAVVHNDTPSPSVEIRVERHSEDWIEVEVADDGPGIPDHEVRILEEGETPLRHADRLGFWLIHWIVSKAGGDFTVADAEPSGSVLTLSVPAHDER